jgi:hypothetical protein
LAYVGEELKEKMIICGNASITNRVFGGRLNQMSFFNKGLMRYVPVILLVALAGCSGPQTDAKMKSRYESKKEYFSELVTGAYCHFDKYKILWRREVNKSNTACLALLAEVEAEGIGIDPLSRGIIVLPSGRNYSSHRKGYVFSAKELAPMYPSLDERPIGLQPYQKGFKKIGGKWYIYYEYDN